MSKLSLFLVLSVSLSLTICQEPQADLATTPSNPPAAKASASQANPNQVQIVNEENEVLPDGKFRWLFELSDGTKVEQTGEPKQGENGTVIAVSGSATWVDPEGKTHTLTYVADENGYQPQGEDVPAIPDAIAKSIQENAAAQSDGPSGGASQPAGVQPGQAAVLPGGVPSHDAPHPVGLQPGEAGAQTGQ